jgi:hypothetical protein
LAFFVSAQSVNLAQSGRFDLRAFLMMRKVKALQISLIISISFFILVLPTYHHYYILVEADLFPTDLSIENPDQEVLLVDPDDNAGMFVSCVFSMVLTPEPAVFKQLQGFSFQISSFDQRTFVLRC